jgi:hypothetical protein
VATKRGSVLITAWPKQTWERMGVPGPPPESPVVASWRLDEDEKIFEQFHDVDAAIEWARERHLWFMFAPEQPETRTARLGRNGRVTTPKD